MKKEDLLQIMEIVTEALKPVYSRFDAVDKKLETVDQKLEVLESRVDSVATSQMRVEQEIGAFREGYQLNKEKIDNHEKRLSKVEKKLTLS